MHLGGLYTYHFYTLSLEDCVGERARSCVCVCACARARVCEGERHIERRKREVISTSVHLSVSQALRVTLHLSLVQQGTEGKNTTMKVTANVARKLPLCPLEMTQS